MAVQIERRAERKKFSIEEYYRLAEAGILREDERVELLEGEIYEMPPIGWVHVNRVNRLTAVFSRNLGPSAIVSVQNPVQIGEFSAPQPDVVLLRPADDFITGRLPGPADVLLLVEVSDTSLDYDLEKKLPLYARAGIPEVWIVDVQAQTIRVYSNPDGDTYPGYREAKRGETLTPELLPEVSIRVEEILG
jgi:Uma2 family endonuclease